MSNTHTDILLAGAFAAFSVDLLVYPLDTIKTRFQSPDYTRLYFNRTVLFRGLYQGIGSVILATIPSSGAFFTTYEAVKSLLLNSNPLYNGHPLIPQPLLHATASSVAELTSCLILTPAEVLKQNAQMVNRATPASGSNQPSATKTATMQALARFHRPSQLWRGYTALAARNLPFTAMQFPLFEHLKKILVSFQKRTTGKKETDKLTLLETGSVTAVSAGSAGAFAAVITTPVDVVKTRIMLSAGDEEGTVTEKRKSSLAVAREVVAKDGPRGLMRGAVLRGLWTAMGSGLYLGVYESGRVLLEDRRDDREGRAIV